MTLSEYVNSIKNKRIGVIGIGISNVPLIRLLAFSGCDVTACDARTMDKLGMDALNLITMGVKLRLGSGYLDNLDFDIIFRTPGLMPFDSHLKAAEEKGSIITSEMEVFFSVCPCRTIAITGSDGKTTTSTIIAMLLKEAGYAVHLGGNIGHPLLCDAPMMKKEDIAVLELSSFQLHSMKCRPDVSVITNISSNHLDKHGTFEDYVEAKKSIFRGQTADDVLVLNADDSLVSSFADEAKAKIRYFGTYIPDNGSPCVYVDNGIIYRAEDIMPAGGCDAEFSMKRLMPVTDVFLPGEHNIKNFIAAFAAVNGLVSDDVCRKVASEFRGVEHRLETVRVHKGVTYINDSIGSSPSRTIAGIHALPKKSIIILGGYDKGIPFDSLADTVCTGVKEAVLTGATASGIRRAIIDSKVCPDEDKPKLHMVPDFDEAVMTAAGIAEEGDIVLFSPACASFDCFRNFEERGNHFKKLVMELE